MKAFQFKLERILSLRKHREREWEMKLAEITGKCVTLMREIKERQMKKADTFLHRAEGGAAAEYLWAHRYMMRLDHEIENRTVELQLCERKREQVRKEYVKHSRDRKVLENLKDKRKVEYIDQQKIEEVKEIDDINTGRAARVLGSAAGRES